MPPWLLPLIPLTLAAKGLWMLARTFWLSMELSRQEVLLDLGPLPQRAMRSLGREIQGVISMFAMCWVMFRVRPWLEAVSFSIMMASVQLAVRIHVQRRPGLLEEGMHVPTRFLGICSQAYIPWSAIHAYTWKGSDLILNPGWRQTTCVIPEEFVPDVEAILIERCPLVGLETSETH